MTPTEIRELRQKANLTLTQAADLIHVRKNTFWRYEAGRQQMSEGFQELFLLKLATKETK